MKKETRHPSPPVAFYIPTDEVATTVKTDKVADLGISTMSESLEITSVACALVHLRLTWFTLVIQLSFFLPINLSSIVL